MDYITQELKRQRAVLSALLSDVSTPETTAGEEAKSATSLSPERQGESAQYPFAAEQTPAAQARSVSQSAQVASETAQALEQLLKSRSAENRSALALAPDAATKTPGGASGGASLWRGYRVGAVAGGEGEAAAPTARTGKERYEAALASVETLSQVVERDARRYDGGFALYD